MKSLKYIYESLLDDDEDLMKSFDLTPEAQFKILQNMGYVTCSNGSVRINDKLKEVRIYVEDTNGAFIDDYFYVHPNFPEPVKLFNYPITYCNVQSVMIYEKNKLSPKEFASQIHNNGFLCYAEDVNNVDIVVHKHSRYANNEHVVFDGVKTINKVNVKFFDKFNVFKTVAFVRSGFVNTKKLHSNAENYVWADRNIFNDIKNKKIFDGIFEPTGDDASMIDYMKNKFQSSQHYADDEWIPFELSDNRPSMKSLFPNINRFTKSIMVTDGDFVIDFYRSTNVYYSNEWKYDNEWRIALRINLKYHIPIINEIL